MAWMFTGRLPLLQVLAVFLLADFSSAENTNPKSLDIVKLEIPHSTRVGQKLYRNAPWLHGVDLKNIIDGHHEWFTLIKDKGDHHLQVNGYLHKLAGQVLQLELLDSETRELAKLLQIFIKPPTAKASTEPPALKYLAPKQQPQSQPAAAIAGPADNALAWKSQSLLGRKPGNEPEFLQRFRRQATTPRIIFNASESAAPGSLLFQLVDPNNPLETYRFNLPPPEELAIDPITSKVYLRPNMGLSFLTKPSILFSIVVLTADGRGIYRLQDYEVQVLKTTEDLNPVISRYAMFSATSLYRGVNTMDGAMVYKIEATMPYGTSANLTYEFIPGMEGRAEGRFRVVPELGLVVTMRNEGYPPARFYDLGVRAVNQRSSSPITKYGYTFVRVFTTFQPPQFSQDAYTFYLMEETAPTVVGQVFCYSMNNMQSAIVLTSRMRTSVSDVLSMDSNGIISSRSSLDYDPLFFRKVWYFTAICTENGTRTTEVEVTIQLVDINDNRPFFNLEYYVNPELIREDTPIGTQVFRIPALDNDSPVNALLVYTLGGPLSVMFNVTRDLVTREAILTSTRHMDFDILPTNDKSYRFTISVSDGVAGASVRPSAGVVIGVRNVNDNPPTIRNFTSVLDKNTGPNSNLIQIQVWDRDGSNIRYYFWVNNSTSSQYPSETNNQFTIDPVTGMVSTGTANLFNIRTRFLSIPYRAIDDGTCLGCPPGTRQLQSEIGYLIFSVFDSSRAAPVFVTCPDSLVNFNEQSPIGTSLTYVTANDPTSMGAVIEYEIMPNTLNPNPDIYFTINITTGQITSTSVIDIDIQPMDTLRNYFWLTVQARNALNSLTSYCSFQLSFTDINDEPPVFDSESSITRVISLNTASGSFIGQVSAFDLDQPDTPGSTIQYFIIEANPSTAIGLFSTSSADNLGTIRSAGLFTGFTEGSKIVLTIEARNPIPLERTDATRKTWFKMTFTIFLTSISRLLPPIVVTEPATHSIVLNESIPTSTLIIGMTASSPVGDARTYEWSEPTRASFVPTNAAFDLHFGLRGATTTACTSNTCNVAVVGQFDYQKFRYFFVRTRVSYKERDPTFGEIYTEVYKRVIIQDVNNRWPDFITRQYVTTVLAVENATRGTMITQAFAVDLDSVEAFRKVVYSLDQTVSQDYRFFAIDPSTGVIRTAADPSQFDAEGSKTVYELQVNASDSTQSALSGVIGPNAKTLRLTVNTLDINDNPPVFARASYSITIKEDTPIDTSIAFVNASDPDVNDKLRYSIESGDPRFQFISVVQTGEIKVAKTLNYHETPRYFIVFVVSDGRNVAKTLLNITLTEVNVHAPSFTSLLYNITNVTEGEPARQIWQLAAADIDSATLTFSISGKWTVAPTAYFSINPNTGILSTLRPLDREEEVVYRLNGLVSDGSLQGYTEINVWPLDVNDNRPRWNYTSLHGDIRDGSSVGTPFMQISVLDPDITGTITYVLQPRDTDGSSYVNVRPDGIVVTTPALGLVDREKLPPLAPWTVFSFLVTATDGIGTPITGTASVTIVDVNDNPPVFSSPSYTFAIPESTEINDAVFAAAATDVDEIDFAQLNYSSPDNPAYFQIVNIPLINAGAILLAKKLDYEDPTIPKSFSFRVVVVDSPPMSYSATQSLTISVLDVNDNVPVITFNPGASITRSEGPSSIGLLVSFTATDADPTDTVITFSIQSESDPYGNLALSTTTGNAGNLFVQVALDREIWNPPNTQDAVHMYVLLAADQRGGTGSATLTVTITDLNDTPPNLTQPSTVTIMENQPVGTIGQPAGLSAEDKDKTENGAPFTYAQDMSAGNNWTNKFVLTVTGTTFQIQSAKVFDRETDGKYFLLQVLLTDRGGIRGTGTVTVIIGDVDDNKIISNGVKQVYVYIYEGNEEYWFNTSTRMSLGYATSMDLDDWDQSLKTFALRTPSKYFELGNFGEVIIKGGTPASNYTLTVVVTDAHSVVGYCKFIVTVTVLPNDALVHSGSMVIDNMDVATFVERAVIPGSYSLTADTYPEYANSIYDNLKLNLASVLNTTVQKTHIFYVAEIPGTRSIIIRYTASGSPHYFAARLVSLVRLYIQLFIRTLAGYGATLRMVPQDQCRLERDGLPICQVGCRNSFIIYPKDSLSDVFNSTALIGINANIQTGCGCAVDSYVPPTTCTYGTCFHDGNCTTIPGTNSFNCSCPAGHEGPRCEKLNVGFTTADSYLVLPSFPGACMIMHLSLYFITVQTAPSVLMLYTGVANLSTSSVTLEKDFLALELINGRPKVTIELGSGISSGGLHNSLTAPALNDGKWHRIDVFINNRVIILKVDGCESAPTVLDGDPAPPNLTSCQYFWTAPGTFSKLNVASFPVFLGGRENIRNTLMYPSILATTGFIGEIAKVRFNSRLYDLYVGSRTWFGSGTVSNLPQTLPSCTWSDGTTKCQNGWCWGVMNGAAASGACVCYSGYRLDVNGRCTIPLEVVELKKSSYLFYKVRPELFNAYRMQGLKLDIQFRTRYTNGTLIIVTGSDPFRPEHMELAIRDSRLVYRHNLGDYVQRDLTLPNANVSDGAWHWVQIIRRLTDVEMIMDHGDYYNYGFMFGNYTSNYNYIVLGDLAAVGAQVRLSAGTTSIEIPSTSLSDTCISTVRINEGYFPVQSTYNSDGAARASLDYSINAANGCPDNIIACPAGVTCPATMVCLPAWRPLNVPVCGCPQNYLLYNGACYAAAACLYTNPCVNGICSFVAGSPKCTCNVGWQGDTCAVAIFAVGSASLIIILVLLAVFILLLIAFLIWYCCFHGAKGVPLLIDVPYENVMEYNEEGGGQGDKLNFDMSQLRVMVTDTTIVAEKVTALQSTRTDFQSILQSRLALANAGPEPSPFDGVLDYEYEGRGAKADDLDSIVSGDENTTMRFDFLQGWGPKFETIKTIYTTFPDNADDMQSVSEFAGPSGTPAPYSVTTTTTTTTRRV